MTPMDGSGLLPPKQATTLVSLVHDARFNQAANLLEPVSRALSLGMGPDHLRGVKIPPLEECELIGNLAKNELNGRCDAVEAQKFTEWLIRTRANSKTTDADTYVRSTKRRFTRHSPAVVKEAVGNLINSSRFMYEPADIDRALGDAESRRRRLLMAARAAWQENQRRYLERERKREIAAERAANEKNPCWQSWKRRWADGRRIAFEDHRLECGGNGNCEACHSNPG